VVCVSLCIDVWVCRRLCPALFVTCCTLPGVCGVYCFCAAGAQGHPAQHRHRAGPPAFPGHALRQVRPTVECTFVPFVFVFLACSSEFACFLRPASIPRCVPRAWWGEDTHAASPSPPGFVPLPKPSSHSPTQGEAGVGWTRFFRVALCPLRCAVRAWAGRVCSGLCVCVFVL
jgi:hypothetical protein